MSAWVRIGVCVLLFGCAQSERQAAGRSASGGSQSTSLASAGSSGSSGGLASSAGSSVQSPAFSTGPMLFEDTELADDDAGVKVELDGPTSALIVFDKSGSMAEPWSSGESRWVAANKALIAALAPVREQLTLGAILFPLPDGCAVAEIGDAGQYAFMPGTEFITRWTQTTGRNAASGSTPLELALAAADRALTAATDVLDERVIVIVLTDGEPTCSDDLAAIEGFPARWLERGIKTHVMGLPGSEAAAMLLDRVAAAGGTEHHQQIGTPDQLRTAVQAAL